MDANKLQMEPEESSHESMKPKNSQSLSERQTTAKKPNRRPQSQKKAEKGPPEDNHVSIVSYVENLAAKQERAEMKRRYKRAFSCKNKIEHLKDYLLAQKLAELRDEHKTDRKRIKEAHENEMIRIDAAWAKLCESYNRKVEQMVYKWEAKKDKEINRLQKEIDRLSHSEIKIRSKDLKELRKAKQYFMKVEDYEEAKLIDKQISRLALTLYQKVEEDMHSKFLHMQQALEQKHEKEEAVLKGRIRRARQEQAMHCSRQKQKLQKKYENVVRRLERQQLLEIKEVERYNRPPMQNPLRLSRRNVEWIIENSRQD